MEDLEIFGTYLYGDGRIPSRYVGRNALLEIKGEGIKIFLGDHENTVRKFRRELHDPIIEISFLLIKSLQIKEPGIPDHSSSLEIVYRHTDSFNERMDDKIFFSFPDDEDFATVYQEIWSRIYAANQRAPEVGSERPRIPN